MISKFNFMFPLSIYDYYYASLRLVARSKQFCCCCCQLNEDIALPDISVNNSHLSVCKQCVPFQVDATIRNGLFIMETYLLQECRQR